MTVKLLAKLFKRFFITFLCCVPLFLVIGFALDGKIQAWIMTFIFVVIGGGVFAVEEVVNGKLKKKREAKKAQINVDEFFKEEPKISKKQKNASADGNQNTKKQAEKNKTAETQSDVSKKTDAKAAGNDKSKKTYKDDNGKNNQTSSSDNSKKTKNKTDATTQVVKEDNTGDQNANDQDGGSGKNKKSKKINKKTK